jgi:hypothetical protein
MERITSKHQIIDALNSGKSIYTVATSMPNGGTHRWWRINERIACLGSGPNWTDQSNECTFGTDINAVASHIYKHRKGAYI